MEDVDIYADLPSFDLNSGKNDQDCNCKELKKEVGSLSSELENTQRVKSNLENNLCSLLKTARAEITRKDKMINDLRKQLDNVIFKRSHNHNTLGFSTQKLPHNETRKYEDVHSMQSQESEIEETESYEIQSYHEYKNRKPQNDVNWKSTVFGERLRKRITEDEKEDKKQKDLLKLSAETKTKDISKENIENDKENGTQFIINNNDNESNIERCSSSEPPYGKNLMKRTNEEDDAHRHKRLKVENIEDKITTEETDYNCLTRYDLINNTMQYEMKDGLEERLDAAHSFKKEEVPFYDGRRASSEYRDTKQDRDNTNEWTREARSNSVKDHDSSNVRNCHASLRNSRIASMSKHVLERSSGYKKNGYRYSPPRRSYFRSRSEYESWSSHRLRERSNRTYREKKYDDYKYDDYKYDYKYDDYKYDYKYDDDYKYDNRYKNDRLKKSYESEKNDRKTRYRYREHDDLRDKYRYSSSDEDKKNSSLYRKYENCRTRKEEANVLNDTKLHENDKVVAETNLRKSSSRTIINSTKNSSIGKNIEQHRVKNESEIKSKDMLGTTSACIVKEELENILEEGEILDDPEKIHSAKTSKDNEMEEDVKIIPVEDKNEDISVNASIDDKSTPLQNDTNDTKRLEMVDIGTKKVEVTSCLLQENLNNCGEIIQLNSNKSDTAVNEVHNCIKDEDKCKSHVNEGLMNSTTQNIRIFEQVGNSDINDSDKNDTDKRSKNSVIETAIEIQEVTNSNIENITKIKEKDDSNIENATEKKEISNPIIVSVEEVNNFNNGDGIHKADDELRASTTKVVTKVKVVLNCDIEDKDKSQASIESETFHRVSNKNDIEMCLNDHNYVQNPSINVSDLDAIQKPSLKSERSEAVLNTATSKEAKMEETINVQSVAIKKTVSSVVKNKKDQQRKGVILSYRRRPVVLSDSSASMTVLMNTSTAQTPSTLNNYNGDSTSKPRACRISRVTAKATCK